MSVERLCQSVTGLIGTPEEKGYRLDDIPALLLTRLDREPTIRQVQLLALAVGAILELSRKLNSTGSGTNESICEPTEKRTRESARLRAQTVFERLASDPDVWATHGLPDTKKERLIVQAIAEEIARPTPSG